MLKSFTASTIKSYQVKFAMEMSLLGNDDLSLCTAIRRVIDHWTIRGKFSSVHPDLEQKGIVRVEVGDEGLEFITKNDVDLTIEVNKRKQEAMKEKMKGNAAYEKQDFATAIHHYEIALELDTNDMVYWSNLAAIMFQIEAFKEVNMVT